MRLIYKSILLCFYPQLDWGQRYWSRLRHPVLAAVRLSAFRFRSRPFCVLLPNLDFNYKVSKNIPQKS